MMTNSSSQTTLLTSHKGIDLHAATALLVMKERLEGGELLENLLRCEVHSFCGEPAGWDAHRLLQTGIYFNPNKHHYGVFSGSALSLDGGLATSSQWLASVIDTDLVGLPEGSAGVVNALLGGVSPENCSHFDVVSYPSGQRGPVMSGVLWRLVIGGDEELAKKIGISLAIARGRKQGILINPHMESWLAISS